MRKSNASLIRQKVGSALVSGFLCWVVWASVNALAGVIRGGRIVNRRGPDVNVSEHPILFWGLSGFFALGIILVTGLALICVFHGLSLFRRTSR